MPSLLRFAGLLLLACRGPEPAPVDTQDSAPPEPPAPAGEVLVHLFEWGWADVARECALTLGPAGVGGVQVSPPQEYRLLDGHPWYERYQPVSYDIIGRSGDEAAFADMVARCRAAGVEIHVDAVLNHMAWANADEGYQAEGYAGTAFTRYDFPGLYGDAHFHDCRRGIEDWGSAWEIHNCELATLPDLATEDSQVRSTLHTYLDRLVGLGVAGFRLDAAKHIPPEDIAAILNGIEGPDGPLSVFQEVITTSADEAIDPAAYFGTGRVTEFRHSATLSSVFREGQLSWLIEWGARWGFHPSEHALVFVDNHDNQRGHSYGDPITYADGGLYTLANAFMLAWPYGRPKLMSSYEIRDPSHGPPMEGDRVSAVHDAEGRCVAPWVCEHRDSLGMVGFRNAVGDAEVVGWWDNGNDQIAFGRGDRGFIVLNREELPTLEVTLQTGLPEGRYCDVYAGPPTPEGCAGAVVEVDAEGEARFEVGPLSAVALHVEAAAP